MPGQYTVSCALHKQPCNPMWESCSFCLIFCLRVCGMIHRWPLNITRSCTERNEWNERNEWRGCTPPLILWLIAHSLLNKLLTGYQLAASPCQVCSVFHNQIVEAATVDAVVSWKLMPGASTKWWLIVCDLSRGWPSEHTHGGGCDPCRRPEPAIPF